MKRVILFTFLLTGCEIVSNQIERFKKEPDKIIIEVDLREDTTKCIYTQ